MKKNKAYIISKIFTSWCVPSNRVAKSAGSQRKYSLLLFLINVLGTYVRF